MACLRGRATPTAQTKLRLFSDSAGHCNRPECRKPLFSEEGQGDYNIGELAHILAAQDGGPRPEPELAQEHRASYSNLILLCPTCHTMIDKCPDEFPDTLLRDWKLRHKARITEAIGVPSVSTRDAARPPSLYSVQIDQSTNNTVPTTTIAKTQRQKKPPYGNTR